jgi:hypothetical protein
LTDDGRKDVDSLDPRLAFGTPEAVVSKHDLTEAEKRRILEQWRYDEERLAAASAEHMEGGEEPMLGRVAAALKELDERHRVGRPGAGGEAEELVVALFGDPASFTGATDDLVKAGIPRAEISILSSYAALRSAYGDLVPPEEELARGIRDPDRGAHGQESVGNAMGGLVGGVAYVGAMIGVGAAVATGIGLVPLAVGGVVGGGAIGGLLAKVMSDYNLESYQDQLEKGGLLVAVATRDAAAMGEAERILAAHGGQQLTLTRSQRN